MPREVIDYKALAERIEQQAVLYDWLAEHSDEQRTWAADLRTVVSLLEGMAEAKPALWMQSNHVSWAGKQPFMARCAPTQLHPDFVPVYLRPAPQPQDASRDAYEGCREDLLDWKRRALRAEAEIRNLTQTPQPQSEPTEAQIEARDALLDFIAENGTASEGVQHYLDRYVRAALAAKEQPE